MYLMRKLNPPFMLWSCFIHSVPVTSTLIISIAIKIKQVLSFICCRCSTTQPLQLCKFTMHFDYLIFNNNPRPSEEEVRHMFFVCISDHVRAINLWEKQELLMIVGSIHYSWGASALMWNCSTHACAHTPAPTPVEAVWFMLHGENDKAPQQGSKFSFQHCLSTSRDSSFVNQQLYLKNNQFNPRN